jgi:DNA-binding CsgD family transcriptional regulator
VLWATGRWDDASAVAEAALADGRGGVTTRITALHVVGYVALARGDWPAARDALSEARAEGERMRELQRMSPALWGLAEVASLTGDVRGGVELVTRGLAASAEVEDGAYLAPFLVTGTRLHLAAGDPLGAARFVDEAERLVAGRAIPGTLPAIDHARGLLQQADGNTGMARATFESVVERWAALGRVWEGTWARIDLARCQVRSNQHDQAAREARTALEAATRLGSPPLEAAAREVETAALRHRTSEAPWAPLTAREFEVARLVTEGLTNPEVAGELGLSPKTVSAHLEHIMSKLGVNRRAEVAAWVAGTGVLHSRPHSADREE